MELTYRESVMDYADHQGNISDACVDQLMREHSTSLCELLENGYKGAANHAPSLLAFMGY